MSVTRREKQEVLGKAPKEKGDRAEKARSTVE